MPHLLQLECAHMQLSYHCMAAQEAFSCCDATNPNVQMKELYGHQISGMFGAPCLPTHGSQEAHINLCPGCEICVGHVFSVLYVVQRPVCSENLQMTFFILSGSLKIDIACDASNTL